MTIENRMKKLDNYLQKFSESGTTKTLVIIGDSFCWGAGIGKEFTDEFPTKQACYISEYDSWPVNAKGNFAGQIAHKYGMNLLNYAIPGCSNDTIFRQFMRFMDECQSFLDDCFVLLFWSCNARYEIPDDTTNHNYCNLAPHWDLEKNVDKLWVFDYHELYRGHVWSQRHDDIKSFNFLQATSMIMEHRRIRNVMSWSLLTYQDEFNLPAKTENINVNFDLHLCEIMRKVVAMEDIYPCYHPTPVGHKNIAEYLLQSDFLDTSSK